MKDIFAKPWAAIPLKFQWKNDSEKDFFGAEFNSTFQIFIPNTASTIKGWK